MAKSLSCHSRTLFACVLIAIMALVVFVAARPVGAQSGLGSITGTLSVAPGTTASSANILVCRIVSSSCVDEHQIIQSTIGDFAFENLLPGDYTIYVEPWSYPGYFKPEYYQDVFDASAATLIPVIANQTTSGIAIEVSKGASIHGYVGDIDDAPMDYVDINACRVVGDECYWEASSSTGPNGYYQAQGLRPGSYKLQFIPWTDARYRTKYYLNSSTEISATTVTVTRDQEVTGIDIQLDLRPSIRGTITNDSGAPVSSLGVVACSLPPTEYSCSGPSDTTNIDGEYLLWSLNPGQYVLYMRGLQHNSSVYPDVYWDQKPSVALATPITVTEDSTGTIVNATMFMAGGISGVVLNESSQPLRAIKVTACWWTGSSCTASQNTYTNGSGAYEFDGLLAGTYKVLFESEDFAYESVYYSEASTLATATEVVVASGADTPGISANLLIAAHAYTATGTVTNPLAEPLAGIEVTFCRPVDNFCGGTVTTDSSGAYTSTVSAPGKYIAHFEDPSGVFLSQYFSGTTESASATPFLMRSGEPLVAINATMQKGVRLLGTFVDIYGNPAENMQVTLCPVLEGSCVGPYSYYYAIDESSYLFGNLAPGSFTLQVDDINYPNLYEQQTYGYTVEHPYPEIIELSSGQEHVYEWTLHRLATVSGTVHNTAGQPVVGAQVALCRWYGYCFSWDYFGYTDANGAYTVRGLYAGTYRALAGPSNDGNIGAYYPNVQDQYQGEDIVVAQSQVMTGLNFTLQRYASVSGRIVDSAGNPVPDVWVEVCPVDASYCGYNENYLSDANGNYNVVKIVPGDYRLYFHFAWSESIYRPLYYKGSELLEGAQIISVGDGTQLTNYDVVLLRNDETPTPVVTPTEPAAPATSTPTHTPTLTSTPVPPVATATATPTLPAPNPDMVASLDVNPNDATSIDVPLGNGSSIHVDVPAGAVTPAVTLDFMTFDPPNAGQPGFKVGGTSFGIVVRDGADSDFTFAQPITLTIHYSDADVAGLDENMLMLRFYNPGTGAWSDDGIEFVSRDLVVNQLVVRIHHLTDFALGDATYIGFLPAVQGEND